MGLCAARMHGLLCADQIYMIQTDSNAASIIDNIEVKTKDAAQKQALKKENAQKAGNATKKGACKKQERQLKKKQLKQVKPLKKAQRKLQIGQLKN